MATMTYETTMTERADRRRHLQALVKNEEGKLKPLAERLKAKTAAEESHRKRVEVLTRHAALGNEWARMANQRERELHSKAADDLQNTQQAIANVHKRIADFQAAIETMDAQKLDAAADAKELAAVLGEIDGERRQEATAEAARAEQGREIARAASVERPSWWPFAKA